MEEKTVEQLQEELESLKKINIERELEIEHQKKLDAEKLVLEQAEEELRKKIEEEVREKLAKETAESKVENEPDKNTVSLDAHKSPVPLNKSKDKFEAFKQAQIAKIEQTTGVKLTGKPYDELVETWCGGW